MQPLSRKIICKKEEKNQLNSNYCVLLEQKTRPPVEDTTVLSNPPPTPPRAVKPSVFLNSQPAQKRPFSHFITHAPSFSQQNRIEFVGFNSKSHAMQNRPIAPISVGRHIANHQQKKPITPNFKISDFGNNLNEEQSLPSVKSLEMGDTESKRFRNGRCSTQTASVLIAQVSV